MKFVETTIDNGQVNHVVLEHIQKIIGQQHHVALNTSIDKLSSKASSLKHIHRYMVK